MNKYYILDEKVPVESGVEEWGRFFEDIEARRVALTDIGEDIRVSTVFLGLDHSFGRGKVPILFETLVSGGDTDGDIERYETWGEAERGHRIIVSNIRTTEFIKKL